MIQFCENHFTASYNPTIAATFTKTFKLRGEEFLCEIVDTAGQVREQKGEEGGREEGKKKKQKKQKKKKKKKKKKQKKSKKKQKIAKK